jgi:membrane protein required for colicin V production
MNWLDICVIVVIALSLLFGLWRGFVREVISVLTWIAAIVIARIYSPPLAPVFSSLTENETAQYFIAFALLCFLTLIVGAIINHFMTKLINMARMQLTDRILGSVFGVARGVLIVAVLVFFTSNFYSEESWWLQSSTIPHIEYVIDWSLSILGIDQTQV